LISRGKYILINCPSCGSNFEGDLCLGCPSCGARSVGPPLAQAEHELPSYGRAVIVSASGVAMTGVFVASVIAALIEFGAFPPRFWSIVAAGEVASWRLKWVMLPVAIVVLWGGARIIKSIKASPSKFIGLRAARLGFIASVLVTVLVATLVAITIPVRLERRQWSLEAASYAQGYTLHRALLEYQSLHGTLPSENLVKELRTLPDSDGSIAEALRTLDASGYNPGSVLAAASTKSKPLVSRGSAIRNAVTGTNATADHGGVSFTSYDLRLPGEDKILNTDDDFIMHDGVVTRVSEAPAASAPRSP
jgi:type II secretory pathway pseudopilin PulG